MKQARCDVADLPLHCLCGGNDEEERVGSKSRRRSRFARDDPQHFFNSFFFILPREDANYPKPLRPYIKSSSTERDEMIVSFLLFCAAVATIEQDAFCVNVVVAFA